MKPHIKMGDLYIHVAGCQIAGWWCEGEKVREWGPTPDYAYRKWRLKALYKRQVSVWMEQHLCPPKPTLWQRIKRAWSLMDCNVADRIG